MMLFEFIFKLTRTIFFDLLEFLKFFQTVVIFFLFFFKHVLANFGTSKEHVTNGFHIEWVLRDGEQEDTEANHDDLKNATQISKEVQQRIDSSRMIDCPCFEN